MADNLSANGNGAAPAPVPVIRALVCPHCRKGRLDPAGKRPGESVKCLACGGVSKVTLEMTLGEDRILERQSKRDKAKRSFQELNDEEKIEFIAKQGGIAQMYYYLQLQLGPRGMIGLYLGLFLLFGALFLTYKLTFGGMELRSVPWWVWLVAIGGGGLIGVVGWFVHGTAMHYYQKHKDAAAAADPRKIKASSARRNATTVRTGKPSTATKRPGSSRTGGPR